MAANKGRQKGAPSHLGLRSSDGDQPVAAERVRMPCPTCPWRRSVPPGGFPGGILNAEGLLRMVEGGVNEKIMQCHCSADARPEVCVGFVLQIGMDSVACRLAVLRGLFDPELMRTDEPLHTLASVLRQHGGHPESDDERNDP